MTGNGLNIVIRPARVEDKNSIVSLLDFLPQQYPKAGEWLDRRLNEAFQGQAYAYCLLESGILAGILLGVLKPNNKFKISTFYIKPEYSGSGLGNLLLTFGTTKAQLDLASAIYLTANSKLEATLGKLLETHKFKLIAVKPNLYKKGDIENVYELTF